MTLAVAGDWLGVPVVGPFLVRSSPEFVDPVMGESMVSGSLSVPVEVSGMDCSAGGTPFTCRGAGGAWGSGSGSGSGGGGVGGFGSCRDG